MIVLTPRQQANIIIDQGGRARLAEYGLGPINSDPSFTVAATSGAVGASRWLAPELMRRSRKGSRMPVAESKAADVFAFGMLAVEVFTGKIPFEGQENEAVALHISQGGRPEISRNARTVGLTDEMWKLFEDCWQQDPKTRPTMEKVVRRLQACVANNDVDNIVSECVHITVLTRVSSSVRLLTSMVYIGNRNLRRDSRQGPVDPRRRLKLSKSQRGRSQNPPRVEQDLKPEQILNLSNKEYRL